MFEDAYVRSRRVGAAVFCLTLAIWTSVECMAVAPARAGGWSIRVGDGRHGGHSIHRSRTFSFRGYGSHGSSFYSYSYGGSHRHGHHAVRSYESYSGRAYLGHGYRDDGYCASRYWRPRVRYYAPHDGYDYYDPYNRRGAGVYAFTLKPDRYLQPSATSPHPYALEAPRAALPVERSDASAQPSPASETAWEALAAGRSEQARSIFAELALATPKEAIPKVGFALASALSGRLAQGAWSMRRAFEVEPDGLEYALSDDRLLDRVTALREQYHKEAGRLGPHDGMFMMAALSYFTADNEEALSGAARLTDAGDVSESTQRLVKLARDSAAADPASGG